MKAILIILSIIFLLRSFNAQNPEEFENLYKNHISFEIGGVTGIASINFEKTFVTKENVKFNYRIRLSYIPLVVNGKNTIGTPINYKINGVVKNDSIYTSIEKGILKMKNDSIIFTLIE